MLRRVTLIVLSCLMVSGCVDVFKTPPAPTPVKPALAGKPGLPAVHTVLPSDKAAVACLDRSNLDALLVRLGTLEHDDDYVRCQSGEQDSCKALTAFEKSAPAKKPAVASKPAPKK